MNNEKFIVNNIHSWRCARELTLLLDSFQIKVLLTLKVDVRIIYSRVRSSKITGYTRMTGFKPQQALKLTSAKFTIAAYQKTLTT